MVTFALDSIRAVNSSLFANASDYDDKIIIFCNRNSNLGLIKFKV